MTQLFHTGGIQEQEGSGRDWFNWGSSSKRVLWRVDEERAGQASGCNSGCGQCSVLLMRSWLAIAADSLIKVLFQRDRLLKGAGRTVRNQNDLVVPHGRCRISTCMWRASVPTGNALLSPGDRSGAEKSTWKYLRPSKHQYLESFGRQLVTLLELWTV